MNMLVPVKALDVAGTLRLEEYFAGRTRAWGIFEDRFRRLRRELVVDIAGRWDGRTLNLHEDFVYSDGETGRRDWAIVRTGPDRYEGRAGDIVGVARGETGRDGFRWTYAMDLKIGGRRWRVRFDDRMYLLCDGVVINRAYVTWRGIRIGSVTLAFRRLVDEPAPHR